jgi:hypothetical protein
MKYLVYTHSRLDTNEVFYIGKGTTKRMKQKCHRSKYWHNIVNKAGGFKATILAGNLTEQEALNFEVLMIAKSKEAGLKLCNLTKGGDGISGFKHSPEYCALQSQRMKNRTPWNKGKKTPPEVIEKLRKAKLGKKLSEEHRKNCSLAQLRRYEQQRQITTV